LYCDVLIESTNSYISDKFKYLVDVI